MLLQPPTATFAMQLAFLVWILSLKRAFLSLFEKSKVENTSQKMMALLPLMLDLESNVTMLVAQ
ncbi:hypothetical protein NC653_001679 [Populus alba x Populus x berolinensis]|uniref:Uncharacterized protein n=1 Tax=Populus alba x Populus x berolinensis TaxID=444605 RepID=A0AAD6RN18_9ROSI|nr:hypothetical protein NC653_001679 [Populus alba x Populus x berolinensis]